MCEEASIASHICGSPSHIEVDSWDLVDFIIASPAETDHASSLLAKYGVKSIEALPTKETYIPLRELTSCAPNQLV